MAVFRERAIQLNADEVRFTISYSKVDVKRALIAMCKLYYLGYPETAHEDEWSEADIKAYFNNTEYKNYPKKVADSLVKWAFKTAVRNQFITPSPNSIGKYLISEFILSYSI